MTNDEIHTEVRAVRAAILKWPKPTLTGGQIAALIQSTAPKLDFRATVGIPTGSGALTAFIEQYLSEQLERVGMQGMDTLHRVKGRELETPSPIASPEVWRTFVSPNSKQNLVLSIPTEQLIARESAASSKEEFDIAKATTAEHDAIRAEFAKALPKQTLAGHEEELSPDAEFEAWMTALRTYAPEEIKRWGHFRRQRLSALLVARVNAAGINVALRDRVLAHVKASEAAAYESRKSGGKGAGENNPTAVASANPPANEAIGRARLLAHTAIDQLSYDELRALKIPLGALLDVVRLET
ncbi:hypothetical protein ACU8L5_36075 (plasmid) [Rhizobium leguminosarum]